MEVIVSLVDSMGDPVRLSWLSDCEISLLDTSWSRDWLGVKHLI